MGDRLGDEDAKLVVLARGAMGRGGGIDGGAGRVADAGGGAGRRSGVV